MSKYNGTIELISGIKQANDQDFPLVEASAVQVDDTGKRLDAELDAISADANIKVYPLVESATTTLEPDKYHVLGVVNELTLTLQDAQDGYAHEYCFEFTTGDEFLGMSITPEPKWFNDFEIEPNKTYQASILRGIGVIAGA